MLDMNLPPQSSTKLQMEFKTPPESRFPLSYANWPVEILKSMRASFRGIGRLKLWPIRSEIEWIKRNKGVCGPFRLFMR